jgi:hypothetical protein
MNEKPNITTERVDDIPLLVAQMERMGLAALLDTHFPTHGNWQGLGFGRVATIWLSSILSRGDHRLVHVEPWVAQRQFTLSHLTGEAVRAHEFSDDRLKIILRRLSDDQRWAAFEAALNPHLVRVYDLTTERVHVDSTRANADTSVSAEGLFQFGHSKDHRPDLPQVKIMQAVLDPLGMPLATDVVSGERADDLLYIPCIERAQQSLGRAACCLSATARWRLRTPEPSWRWRAIMICAPCLRCNSTRASWIRPLCVCTAASKLSARSFGNKSKVSPRRHAPSAFSLARGTQFARRGHRLSGGGAGTKRAFGMPIR